MSVRNTLGTAAALLVATLVFFDVDLKFDVAPSRVSRSPDPAIEAAYEACFQTEDDEIHTTAFGTIDNPDVQKEFIASNRARAARECRERHPERLVETEEPFRFDLVDLTPRYW